MKFYYSTVQYSKGVIKRMKQEVVNGAKGKNENHEKKEETI